MYTCDYGKSEIIPTRPTNFGGTSNARTKLKLPKYNVKILPGDPQILFDYFHSQYG